MNELRELGWQWHENGAMVRAVLASGATADVFVPLEHLRLVFGAELARVGCPPSVGYAPNVSGFFSSLKKLGKKVVPKAVRRAAKRVTRTVNKAASSLGKGGRKALLGAIAPTYLLHANPAGRKGMQAASLVPIPVVQQAARATRTAMRQGDRWVQGKRVFDQRFIRDAAAQGMRQVKVPRRVQRAVDRDLKRVSKGVQAAQQAARGMRLSRAQRSALLRAAKTKKRIQAMQTRSRGAHAAYLQQLAMRRWA